MSRKWDLPKFPDSYIDEKAKEYNISTWMERNQKKTTFLCIEYLHDEKLDQIGEITSNSEENPLILDMGCGTGFSSEILVSQGFRVVAIDLLQDMIYKAKHKKGIYEEYESIELVLADINHLPFRNSIFELALSVSAYNFIIHGLEHLEEKKERLNDTARTIFDILKRHGRVVIEFYPTNDQELELFTSSFTRNGFDGFYIKQRENQQSGQTFLLLKKVKKSRL